LYDINYIKQAKALVNLVGNYGKTDLDKAKDCYDILEKLADKHQHQEIYITQAKALVNPSKHQLPYLNDEEFLNPTNLVPVLENLANSVQ
jgi:hypothetical protein